MDLFKRDTNPYARVLGGDGKASISIRVLGSDGLNIADLKRLLAKKVPKEECADKDNEKDDKKNDDKDEAIASLCVDALNQTPYQSLQKYVGRRW